MRRLLRCKIVTIIAAIIPFTVIPAAGIVATATPALASVNICVASSNSHHYCAGDPGALNNVEWLNAQAGTSHPTPSWPSSNACDYADNTPNQQNPAAC